MANRSCPVVLEKFFEPKIKNPEVKKLSSYEDAPPANFWDSFPSFGVPSKISQKIDVDALESLVKSQEQFLTCYEISRAQTCCNNLRFGADSFLKSYLPPLYCKKCKKSFILGEKKSQTRLHLA